MKRKIYLMMTIPLVLLSVIKIDAQQWIKITPTFNPPGEYNLERGVFLDEYNGWFADVNKIFQTTNGGLTWNMKVSSVVNAVETPDIFFVNASNGWVLFNPQGDSSLIYRTTDGGKNWRVIKTPKISRFYFTTANKGVGTWRDSIYNTTDGGVTWTKIVIEQYEGTMLLNTIFFLDEKKGWAVGGRIVGGYYRYPAVLTTNDGGNSWIINNFKTDYEIGMLSVAFADSLNGVISDNILHYHSTSNGGKEWIRNNDVLGFILYILFSSEKEGWMTGAQGFIAHSTDKGKTWEKVISPTNNQLGKISFVRNNTVGFIFGGQNTLLRYDKSVNVADNSIKQIPTEPILHQNYPNPFNSSTILTFELPDDNFMELKLYDFLGQEIAVIEKGLMNRGEHKVLLNAQTLSSGTYFCLLKQGNYFSKIKLVLIK
jgi:photosystem II stability/assembly factor-like uncharacterized protein